MGSVSKAVVFGLVGLILGWLLGPVVIPLITEVSCFTTKATSQQFLEFGVLQMFLMVATALIFAFVGYLLPVKEEN